MSISVTDYLIFGYDLTDWRDSLLTEEFCESDEYERWINNARPGQVQIFDDPMHGDYLFIGYIADEFEDDDYSNHQYIAAFDGAKTFKEIVDVELEDSSLPEGWREAIRKTGFDIIAFREFR